jgi:hypothetical protein
MVLPVHKVNIGLSRVDEIAYIQNWRVYSERVPKCALCYVPYVTGLPVHLFQTQIYHCKADHSTNITLHKRSHYVMLYIK